MVGVSKHRASRFARRGRLGVLGVVIALMLVAVGSAVVVLPQLRADAGQTSMATSAEVDPGPAAIESALLSQVPQPPPVVAAATADVAAQPDPAPPADSGDGRRIVFDQGDQRVWLIGADNTVERTYPVSGSRFENLKPGAYSVTSKTRHATAFDASGTMEYFVRFATGFSEPIGFHSVPHDNTGKLEQAKAQLGERLSAGCVRQWKNDAIALWEFAPIGTKVYVTA